MRRRTFLGALGAVATLPFAARAQRASIPMIGFVRSTSAAASAPFVSGFGKGLGEGGFVEGKNVMVEYLYADDQLDRLRSLAAELIRSGPAVIVTNSIGAFAMKSLTKTIPIVFGGGGDPVKEGLVASLNRPGSNVTGITFFAGQLGGKRLELLLQIAPKTMLVGVLMNPNTAETEAERKDIRCIAGY